MLAIFLDFDGVLNKGSGPGDPVLVERLNLITDRTGAVLIIHSSWRWGRSVTDLTRVLRSWKVKGTVHDAAPSPMFYKTPGGIYVTDGDFERFRGSILSKDERCIAIQKWLDEHPGTVERFVILDDSPALGHFVGTPEFIQTETSTGLTHSQAEYAIRHLRGTA